MNKIIESFLKTHISEYELGCIDDKTAFEHFINRCIINKYTIDRFDPDQIMTDSGEKGLDGVAIIVNDKLVLTEDELDSVIKEGTPFEVKFVFIQSKTSEKFDGSEIGDFIYGVKAFFETASNRPITNEKMERLIALKDKIYAHGIDLKKSPEINLYYVCCGKWNEGNGLVDRINIELNPLRDSSDFSMVNFFPYDSDKVIVTYKELKKKISKKILMDKRITLPIIDGVKQAFVGIVRCKDFVSILTDSDGKMLTNIFEDNVRDFQGYNSVNKEIKDTINNVDDQNRFVLLNNGITVIAKTVNVTGDMVDIFDYQIVNGCQTSYVLYDNSKQLTDKSYVVMKLLEISDEKISDRVIFTTNRQTEVKAEAFTSTKPFHKKLQDCYDAIEQPCRLFYERRSKQYDLNDNITKRYIVTLAMQVSSYLAVFLNEPHSTHRYYGELLRAYENKIFLTDDAPEIYYIAAYLVFYIDEGIRKGIIPKKYKIYRYHIACVIKGLEVGNQVIFGQGRKQKKEFDKLYSLIMDKKKLDRYLKSAVSCLEEVLKINNNVSGLERHRSKEITKELLKKIQVLEDAKNDKHFLNVGDTVQCVVESMNKSFVYVTLKTDDSRNYGSIHISKVARKYIEDLSNEISVGDTFRAKIIGDFFDTPFGWELSRFI